MGGRGVRRDVRATRAGVPRRSLLGLILAVAGTVSAEPLQDAGRWEFEELGTELPADAYRGLWNQVNQLRKDTWLTSEGSDARMEHCATHGRWAEHAEQQIVALEGALTDGDHAAAPAELGRWLRSWQMLAADCHLARAQNATHEPVDERLAWLERAFLHCESAERADAGRSEEQRKTLIRLSAVDLLNAYRRPDEALSMIESVFGWARLPETLVPFAVQAADIERRQQRFDVAFQWLRRARERWEARDYQTLPAAHPIQGMTLYGCLARLYMDLGVLDRAVEADVAMEEQIQLVLRQPSIPVRDLHAAVSRAAGRIYLTGRHAALVRYAERHLADNVVYRDYPQYRADLQLFLALALAELERREPERPRRARALLEEIRTVVAGEGNRILADHGLAGLALTAGDSGRAAEHLDAARSQMAGGELERGGRDSLNGVATQAMLEGRLALLQHRSSAAGQRASLAVARDELQRALGRVRDAWQATPLRPGGLGFLYHASRRSWISELIVLQLELEGAETGAALGLEELLRAQALGSLVRFLGGQPGTPEDVRAGLCPEGGGILVYLPAPERSHVFIIERGGVRHVELERDDVLLDAAAAYSAEVDRRVATGAPGPRRETDRELSSLLFPGEVADAVAGWSSVTIVGADLLSRAPIELLPVAASEYLCVDRAVAFLPSLPLGLALLQRAGERGSVELDFLLVADPRPGSTVSARPEWNVARLPFDESHRVALTEAYDPSRVRVLLGERATLQGVLAEPLGRVRVAQFLAHGVLDYERERLPALVLDELYTCADVDGLRSLEDVESARKARRWNAPELAILTACRTAQGAPRPGDAGAADLGGAFLRAGSQVVLQSAIDLAFSASVDLSARFHRALVTGASPAGALRQARRSLAEQDPTGIAVLGSALRVVGLGHRPLFERAPSTAARVARSPGPERSEGGDVAAEPSQWRWLWPVAAGLLMLGAALAVRRGRGHGSSPRP